MNIKLSLLTLALAGLLAGGVIAEEAQQSIPSSEAPAFESLDADSDGAITTEEASKSWLAMYFEQVDTDHNGSVSKAEYEKALS